MKRLVVTGPRIVELQDVPAPECPRGGLLVRALVTALSTGTEMRTYRGTPVDPDGRLLYPSGVPLEFPYEIGYSMVGRVEAVGADVDGFSVGDRVFVGEPHKQYAAVAADLAFKLPESLPDESAAFLNVLNVGQLALRKGRPGPGENVAIVGLGVIGLSVLAFCRAFRFRALAVDTDERRLAVASAMGAEATASPRAADLTDILDAWSGGRGADVVIEAATAWPAIKTAMDIVRPRGTVVVVATHTDIPDFSPVSYPYNVKDVALLTSYGYDPRDDRWDKKACMSLAADLLASGEMDVAPMIDHRVEWSELPDVYRRLDGPGARPIGVVVRWPVR
jgi:threonine dehydrogenase-like Zn-dependent dehydrogenase